MQSSIDEHSKALKKEVPKRKKTSVVICVFDYQNQLKDDDLVIFWKKKPVFSFVDTLVKCADYNVEEINGNIGYLTTEEMSLLKIEKRAPLPCLEFDFDLPDNVKSLVCGNSCASYCKEKVTRKDNFVFFFRSKVVCLMSH